MTDAPIVVAYSCAEKKRAFFDNLSKVADSIPGVTCVPYESLNGTPHDALIHKRTDDLVATLTGDRAAAERYRQFRSMLPESVVAVDKPAAVHTVVDRGAMSRVVSNALERTPSLSAFIRDLRWAVIQVDAPRAKLVATLSAFEFPVIIKRRLACGTPESHMMAIAEDVDAAILAAEKFCHNDGKNDEYSRTMFVQEFVPNHESVVFKLYSVGERVAVQKRCSVPEKEKADKNGNNCVHFNSQLLSKRYAGELSPRTVQQNAAPMLPVELSRRIATVMQAALNLSLIGIDLVFDVTRGLYSIVDVNYLPGFKGVENADKWLMTHVVEKVLERRRRRVANAVYRAPVTQWVRLAGLSSCGDRSGVEVPSYMVIRPDVRNVRQILGKGAY